MRLDKHWRPAISGNAVKVIALVTMTVDHVGLILLGNDLPFRIIGRLSFPLFAYMIAEGCRYTRNKRRYWGRVLLLGLVCQAGYYLADHSFYQGILMTFSGSILLVYAVQWAQSREKRIAWLVPWGGVAVAAVLCYGLPALFLGTDLQFDYGFWGMLLPVFPALSQKRSKGTELLLTGVGIAAVSASMGGIQWWSLGSLVPLALYDGSRGKHPMKNLFYIYYPVHMVVIYGLSMLF